MSFAHHLRQVAEPVWTAILAHPYLKELAAGTLPRATFRNYVQQDWLYLQEFMRAAALIAARCPEVPEMKFLLTWLEPLVSLEHHFHRRNEVALDLNFDDIRWRMNEANWAYTRHMLAAAYAGSTLEALAALLPCPCVYAHVGTVLAVARPTDPLYAEWIQFYGPGRVAERISPLEQLCDRLAETAGAAERERAEWNYLVSSRYEWLFWDAAYRQADWPV